MNESWAKGIAFVLSQEGGLTNDPNDPGGLTNFGISQKSYPSLDIKNLTVDQASAIYQRDYWQACSCDQLAWPFDMMVFDTAVNQGTSKAIRLLQIALDVTVDGIIGSNTIKASFNADASRVKMFLAQRLAAYTRLIASSAMLMNFALNWSHRVISLAEIVLQKTSQPEGTNVS
jgi:lysozyme family protein